MIRFILHGIFKLGRIPVEDLREMEAEKIEVIFEGVPASITYRKFRAPLKYFHLRRQKILGSLVITDKRFAAYAYRRRIFNVPLRDSRLSGWKITVEDGKRLCLAGDASVIGPDYSGNLEFRFTITEAEKIAQLITNSVKLTL